MFLLLVVVHILVCVFLILVVLLQTGKGADLAGAFGGGGSQTALGSRGAATVLSKATTVAAVLFMITSLGLAILSSRRTSAVLQATPPAIPATTAPKAPAPAPAPPTGGTPAPAGESAPATPNPPAEQPKK
jgi:preprotein translocase subunit SecG